MSYHGRIVEYSDTFSPALKQAFLDSLPKRTEFIDTDENRRIVGAINGHEPVLFLPNDILESHWKTDEGKLLYKIVLIGVLRDGSKASVVIRGIYPSFDIRVPADADSWGFINAVRGAFRETGVYCKDIDTFRQLPGKLFKEAPIEYLRISFWTLFQRKKGLVALRTGTVAYPRSGRFGPGNGQLDVGGANTANDDQSCYYRKIAREMKIKLCGWNWIKGYTMITGDTYTRKHCVPYCFEIDTGGITEADPDMIRETKDLVLDKTMIAGWDLETYARESTGSVPDPMKVFGKDGKEEDIVFLDSMPFSWYWSKRPFLVVAVTTLRVDPLEDCLIVKCSTQAEIIKVKGLILERMSPELLTGFNDGMYDWPFLLRRADAFSCVIGGKDYKLTDFLKKHMAVVVFDPSDKNSSFLVRGEHQEKIKLEAGGIDYEPTTFVVPGTIVIDTRGVFMQMNPKAEKSSLNYFLEQNNLGLKNDMPYLTMFKIENINLIMNARGCGSFASVMKYFEDGLARDGPEWKPFAGDQSAYRVDRLTVGECIKMYGGPRYGGSQSEGTDMVVRYCNKDAEKCADLFRVQNIIPDKRAVANLSYTSLFDALYRAGGMKVRNMVISYASLPEWNLGFSNISTGVKDARKYPGAYVVSPKKGLYRDHKIVKRKRRAAPSTSYEVGAVGAFTNAVVSPDSPEFDKSLLDETGAVGTGIFGAARMSNDENDDTDRPCTGLDFSSLYPSLIMTYNLSPEKVVLDRVEMMRLRGLGFEFVEVNFKYGLKDVAESEKETIQAWIVQHNHPARKIIVDEVARAKGIDPGRWRKHMDPEVVARVKKMFKETTLDQWRTYGMGIYPYILKDLFDRRSRVKKSMEHFAVPREFLENVFKNAVKEGVLDAMPVEAQKAKIGELIAEERARREAEFVASGKKFHKYRIGVMDEIRAFMKAEWKDASGPSEARAPSADSAVSSPNQSEDLRNAKTSSQPRAGLARPGGISELYSEIVFRFTYYNTMQLALKVFMNTFYGETGNQLSAMFIVAVAGGITSWGQYNTKMVKRFVEGELYNVLYGDTDSLYICCPEYKFAEMDKSYLEGRITKLQYWTRMIEVTMETMDEFKEEVNTMLMIDNKSPFLTMAYEEALYPYMMAGKKKYIGIQHKGIVNLAACLPECVLNAFMKDKSLFIRGLEIVKRGASEFLKQVCYDVFKMAFCITEVRTMKQILEHKLSELSTLKLEPRVFAKSAKYKLPGMAADGTKKQGNLSVLRFIDRMKGVETQWPETGIKVPDVGERFKYVIVRRYPWVYDLKGCQRHIGMDARYEFIESLSNAAYIARVGELVVDIDYYITNEIIGQFARFIIYHPDYDQYFKTDMTDEEYKEADARAWSYAKKTLTAFYNQNYTVKYVKKGKIHKEIFKTVNKQIETEFYDRYGAAGQIFTISNSVNLKHLDTPDTTADAGDNYYEDTSGGGTTTIDFGDLGLQNDVINKLLEEARKLGEKIYDPINVGALLEEAKKRTTKKTAAATSDEFVPNVNTWFNVFGLNSFSINVKCILSKGSYYRTKREFLLQRELELSGKLRTALPTFQKLYQASLNQMSGMIERITNDNGVNALSLRESIVNGRDLEMQKNIIIGDDVRDVDLSCIDSQEAIIWEVGDLFSGLVAVYKELRELDSFRDQIKDLSTATVDKSAMPQSFKRKTVKDDFLEWLHNNR